MIMHRQSVRQTAHLSLIWIALFAGAVGLGSLCGTAAARDTADPALRDYLSGNGLLNRGMNDLAIAEYRKFLAANANHEKAPLARYGLGVALFRTRDFQNAVKELEPVTAVKNFEYAAETQLIIGQSQLHLQEYGKAAAALDRVVKEHAAHDLADDAAAMLAEALYRDGKHDQVQSAVQTLVSKSPESPHRERAEFFGGAAQLALQDYANAAKSFAALLQRFPQGAGGQFSDQASLFLAQSLHQSKQNDQAITQYQVVIKNGTDETKPDALFGLATLQQQKQEHAKAGELLDQLLKDYPEHRLRASALLQRGRVWLDQDQIEKAFNTFSEAANAKDTQADHVAYWLAKCEIRLNEFAAAAERLAKAIEQYPKSQLAPEMSYDRAVALMRAGQPDDAGAALGQFAQRFGSHSLAADALYLHAMIEHQQKRFDASQQLCIAFLQKHGQNGLAPSIAFLSAENEFLSDRLDKAAERYAKFIADYPKDEQLIKAKYRLGSAQFQLQQFDKAEPNLLAATDCRNTAEPFRRALYLLGDINFQKSDWPKSVQRFEDFLSFGLEQPSADDALLKMGLAHLRQQRTDQAMTAFATLEKEFPKSVHRIQAIFEQGQLHAAKQNWDDAATAFERVLNEGGDSRFQPHALNHLASIAMQRQQFEQAASLYKQLAATKEQGDLAAQAMFMHGQALMSARNFNQASAAFATFVNQYPKDARAGQAMAQRAVALSRDGQPEEALSAIDAVQREHARDLSDDLLAAVLYEKAWCLRELKRLDEAAQAYRELLAAHESQAVSVHGMLELAELEFSAKRFKESAELLSKLRQRADSATNDVPNEVQEAGLYRLAVAKYELGEYEDSAAFAEEFVAKFPSSALIASARSFAGESQFKLDKHQKAAEHFNAVITQFASDAACGPSMLRLGECQAALNQWKQSEQTFANYLKKFTDSEFWFQAQFGFGWALENQSRHDEAMDAYRKVIEKHSGPTAARSQFQIGECLFAKKKFEEAVRELLKVDILYGYPEWSAAALYEAGRCFEELAKPSEAQAQYEQVRQKYPETRWAELAAQRLAAKTNGNTSGG
jgi:cellulose synthase operon protein C